MDIWTAEDIIILRENSTADNWKSEEELEIFLGKTRKQINKKRWELGLKRTPEQRRTHDYICKNCGNHFYNKHIGRKFCSEECHRKWQQKNHIERMGSKREGVVLQKTCLQCGKTFEAPHRTSKFCSKKCYSLYGRKDLSIMNKKKVRFDKQRFLALYKRGFNDREISRELADLHLGDGAIARQRRNLDLPPNPQKRKPPKNRERSEYMKQYREKHRVKNKRLSDFIEADMKNAK